MLAMGSSALFALGVVAPAQAQDTGEDEIVVTGSRIPQNPNLINSIPVQSVDQQDVKLSGEINLADVVNDIPALIASTTGENSVTGANALSLRGLGTQRTLTLVNGRRHVAGFEGSAAVDIGSIPEALVERVEVTTGGASAIYGSDAVTGVVNFILKEDFEGAEFDARAGMASEGDAENFSINGTLGTNFDNDRGNIVLSVGYVEDSALTMGDRDWSRNGRIADDWTNPDLRFQSGDIGADTPNFAQFYNLNTGRFSRGFRIPTTADDFISAYTNEFGSAPSLTSAEMALIARAAGAPARAILPFPTFSITSPGSAIIPGNFSPYPIDLDGNGVFDCDQSFTGYNVRNYLAGCWVVDADGTVRPFQDGLIAGALNQFGGDGVYNTYNGDFLLPETDKFSINLNTRYEIAPNLGFFFEGKYVESETQNFSELDAFFDTIYVFPDNAYIPDALQQVADDTFGLFVSRDPVDLGSDPDIYNRKTTRVVGGLEWESDGGTRFELTANLGRFEREFTTQHLLLDRFFAAMDAVEDGNGNIVCRSELDPTFVPEQGYLTGGRGYVPGFYTFTPGAGQCQPLSVFSGPFGASEAAQDFVNVTTEDNLRLTQATISGILSGNVDKFESVLDGPLGYAAGFEYRRESSRNLVNPYDNGILPSGSPLGAGNFVGDVAPGMNALNFDNAREFDSSGSFDVSELFAEVRLPVLLDKPGAKEFTIDAAVRHADYSRSGGATSWKVGSTWAPVDDLSIRGTLSRAVRAPNINELFSPPNPATFRPFDPCDANQIATAQDPATREANCIQLLQRVGVNPLDGAGNYVFEDPLTARFVGVIGGNENLDPETADTFTIGAVLRPSFLDNFSVTVDYWDVDISNVIQSPTAQDVVDNCADTLSDTFCGLFSRNDNAASPTFGGLNFLSLTPQNFNSARARGIDFAANYKTDWGKNTFGAALVGSRQLDLDLFPSATDANFIDPELGEIQRPKLSGNLLLSWERGPAYLGFQTTYQGEQGLSAVEIETFETVFGQSGIADETFVFDLNGSFDIREDVTLYGGVNNITNETPFITETAWPVGPRGTFGFIGVTIRR